MTVELITGRGSTDHVGSEDFGAYQAHTFGTGVYVLSGCEASVVDSNTIRISEGEMLLNGRHVRIKGSEDVAIQSGTVGRKRKDLICVRYTKDSEGIEDAPIAVIVGTPTEGEASYPSHIEGNILDGDVAADFPLYGVSIDSLAVAEPVLLMEREEALLAQIAGKADAKSYLPLAGGRMTGALSFANGAYIMGVNTSGVASSSFEAKTPNNRTTVGYGGYAANEGATDIYGHAVSIQANANFNFYGTDMYKNGLVLWGGKVLYANDAGSTGTVALSDSAANYTLVEVYYVTNDGGHHCAKVYSPNGKTVDLMGALMKAQGGGATAMYFKLRRVVVSGTSVYTTGDTGESSTTSANTCTVNSSASIIALTKIIGYK